MNYRRLMVAAGICALNLGCASAPGTQPNDMSALQHEGMAAQEEQAAAGHAEQHNPAAMQESTRCAGKGGCWTSVSNPTARHADDAARHRELAAKHRAASTTLLDAESRACAGVPDDDRDMSPFYHREDIESVATYKEEQQSGKGTTLKEVGATIVFRAVPGLTAEWLQRVVDCHLARSAAAGHSMPEMDYCPLALKGVKAKVVSVGNGFAVNVWDSDPGTIAEISKRANALAAPMAP